MMGYSERAGPMVHVPCGGAIDVFRCLNLAGRDT